MTDEPAYATCSRCRRPAPPELDGPPDASDEDWTEWEIVTVEGDHPEDDVLVCPGCLTEAGQLADLEATDAAIALASEWHPRCTRIVIVGDSVSTCGYLDISVSWTWTEGDPPAELPKGWTCPQCGASEFEPAQRDPWPNDRYVMPGEDEPS